MERVAHYDVVKNFDFEKLPGAYQVACYPNVGFGWRWVAAGVIVCQYNGGCGGHNCQPEYFTSRNKNGIQRADADEVMTFHAAACVQNQDNEAFTLVGEIRMRGDVQSPIIGRFLWRVAQLQTLRRRTFPQLRHLVFIRLRWKGEGLDNLEAGERWRLFIHGVLGRVEVGWKVAAIFPARVLVTGGCNRAAWVLPESATVVPMESKLRQRCGDLPWLFAIELNPNPFAHYFRQFPKVRCPRAQQVQDSFSRKSAIVMPQGHVNRPQRVFSALLCGPVLEL
jgi:hypothetical protein